MTAPVRPLHAVLAIAAALAAIAFQAHRTTGSAPARPADTVALTAAQRAGVLRFAPGTGAGDAQAVRDAIAAARPEARRLIDLVDGAVTVSVRPTGIGSVAGSTAVGTTQPGPDGFSVVLDLGGVAQRYGARGIGRVVLHEFGHVVDMALVPPALRAQLDAAIPPGYPCARPDDPACAGRSARAERFAETFAKWATGDIGVGLDLGYAVPAPPSLDAWGAPLTALR